VDVTTGLDYAKNRYYSNTLGRFLTPDPKRRSARLGDPGTWNRYAYSWDDPVNRYDPSGLGNDDGGDDGCTWAGNTLNCQANPVDPVVQGNQGRRPQIPKVSGEEGQTQ
jgi:RHS repeat-associated protein